MTAGGTADISGFDRLHMDDGRLRALLARGEMRRELQALFGAGEYALLGALARRALRARVAHRAPVYLVPGVLGTQLGQLRPEPAPPNLLWIDPHDIIAGGLARLRLPEQPALVTMGALPYTYLALQLRLQAAGWRVIVHDYDWRQDIDTLARAFAARLAAETAPEVVIVAHSMGGLVARSALRAPGLERVRRLIALGTPHGGSYGAVQALRGTYAVVRRLAALDHQHDAESLAAEVFSTFPSLYQLLPAHTGGAPLDLHELAAWPSAGPRPDARLLAAARDFARRLPPPDARCVIIAGTQQRTVTGLRLAAGDFDYEISDAGDGTVPLAAAQLPGCSHYYVRCEHSALPRSPTVARAIIDLLRHGATTALRTTSGAHPARLAHVSDRELRATWVEKIDWTRLTPAQRRDYLNRLNVPPAQYAVRRR